MTDLVYLDMPDNSLVVLIARAGTAGMRPGARSAHLWN